MAVSAPHANGRQLLLQADRQFAIFSPVLLVFVVRSLVRYAASKESIPHNKRKNIYIYPLANMLTLGSWAVFFLFISVFCLYIFAELHTQVHAAHIYTLHMCKRGPYQLSLRQRAVSHVVQCSRLKLLENYKKKKIYYRERKLVSGDTELTPISHFHPHDRRVYIQYIHAYTRLECLLHTDSGTTLYS